MYRLFSWSVGLYEYLYSVYFLECFSVFSLLEFDDYLRNVLVLSIIFLQV